MPASDPLFPKANSRKPRNLSKSLAPKVPDPLADAAYVGEFEVDAASELDLLQAGFRARRRAEDSRFRAATDSEYWFAVCFKTRAEKDLFLRLANLAQLGDKYLDGEKVAAILNIKEKP